MLWVSSWKTVLYLHSPKDIPYSHAAHYKANPGYDEQLVQIVFRIALFVK